MFPAAPRPAKATWWSAAAAPGPRWVSSWHSSQVPGVRSVVMDALQSKIDFPVPPLMSGYLEKRKPGKPWERRFCAYIGSILMYYKPGDVTHKPSGFVMISSATVSLCGDHTLSVKSSNDKKSALFDFELRADSRDEALKWLQALTKSPESPAGHMAGATKGDAIDTSPLQEELGWTDQMVTQVLGLLDDSLLLALEFMSTQIQEKKKGAAGKDILKDAKSFMKTYKSDRKNVKKGGSGTPRTPGGKSARGGSGTPKKSSLVVSEFDLQDGEEDESVAEVVTTFVLSSDGASGIVFGSTSETASVTYIKSIKPDTPASQEADLGPGMRLVSIGGDDPDGSWTRECAGLPFRDAFVIADSLCRPLTLNFVQDLTPGGAAHVHLVLLHRMKHAICHQYFLTSFLHSFCRCVAACL